MAQLLIICMVTSGITMPVGAASPPALTTFMLGASVLAPAAVPLSVGNYSLVGTSRYSRTHFDFTYRATITNASAESFAGVIATVRSLSSATTVLDATINYGNVGPGASFSNADTFTIRQDRMIAFNPADLVWSFTFNHAPVALDDAVTGAPGQPVKVDAPGVLGNDTDPDGNPISASISRQPANGTVALNSDGSFTYTPKPPTPVSNLNPKLKWSWTSSAVLPDSINVVMTPAVIDLNGDGVPDVVFGSTASRGGSFVEVGVLRALSGADGRELFTVTDPALAINAWGQLAIGDIDGDGRPEIILGDASGQRLIAFEHDGTFKWRSPIIEPINWGGPAIADLDGDGQPEIIVGRQVLNADGTLRWTGTGGRGDIFSAAPRPLGSLSVVADIDLDGITEVVAGNTTYHPDGTTKWQASVPDGYIALGNFDDDPFAEIVLVSGGRVWLLEHTGAVKWGPTSVPGGGNGGPPTVADFDGDGNPEIGVAGASRYVVIETDGSIKWQTITQDGSSNVTGSSVFDFEGDGAAEVVYRDELKLRVYRGQDGTLLFETPMSSCTGYEYPLVADIDDDGHAEIVSFANDSCGFGPQRGIYVFADAGPGWAPTRKIWNQHTYHVTNVNEDGTIPRREDINWLFPSLNNFRLNAYAPADQALADSFTYRASDGTAQSNEATVRITLKKPNQPPVITSVPVTTATTGQPYTYDVNAIDPDRSDELTYSLTSNPEGMTIDAATGLISWTPIEAQGGSHSVTVKVQDSSGLSVTQEFIVVVAIQNNPPVITTAGIAPQWTQLAPAGTPPEPRHLLGSASAYDEINDRLMFFGGDVYVPTHNHPSDVWVLVNASSAHGTPQWLKLSPTGTAPVGRHSNSLVYDPTANRIIVYGGCIDHCSDKRGDVWVLTNANGIGGTPEWIQLSSSQALAMHAAGYDPISNRMIVFGGVTGGPGTDVSTIRILTDANGIGTPQWLTPSVEGTQPPPRGHWTNATYDRLSNRIIVFGGTTSTGTQFNDVWVLHNANAVTGNPRWEQLSPAGIPPSPRGDSSVIYDQNSNRLIAFGGFDHSPWPAEPYLFFNETWVLTNANGSGGTPQWFKLKTPDPVPSPRGMFASGYSRASNRLVVAMGRNAIDLEHSAAYNDAWILSNANGLCTAGQLCRFQAEASDPDPGDTLTFSLDSAPAGMTIDVASGSILWTPTPADVGNKTIVVRATDRGGLAATQTFTATVAPVAVPNVVGLAPEWAESFITAADLTVGTKTSLGGAITLKFDSLPSRQGWEYVALNNTAGENEVFSIADGTLFQNSLGVGFQGQGANRYGYPEVVNTRLPFSISVRARVLEEKTFELNGAVKKNSFGFDFGAFTGFQEYEVGLGTTKIQAGVDLSYFATDVDNTLFKNFQIDANPAAGYRLLVDEQPLGQRPAAAITIPNHLFLGDYTGGTNARAEVTAYSFTQPRVVGQNPPPGTLVPNKTAVDLTIIDGPATEKVPNLSELSQEQSGTAIIAANLTVGGVTSAPSNTTPAGQVSDQSPLPGIHVPKGTPVNIVISTGPVINQSPAITSAPVLTVNAGQAYAYDVNATDQNAGDVLSYSLTTAPTGMTIDPATGLINWVPAEAQVGDQPVTVRVTDPGGLFVEQKFSIKVLPGNNRPTATGQTLDMLRAIPFIPPFWSKSGTITLSGEDPDGDPLSYELVDRPIHGEVKGTPPSLTYVPNSCFAGADSLTFRVSDGKLYSDVATVNIYVGEDCNRNNVSDPLDIVNGTSKDCNGNGVPDECDVKTKGRGFANLASWSAYDPGAHGVGKDPDGYAGGAFDGRYVYFAPYFNGSNHSGEILRFDTVAEFDTPESWKTYDLPANGVGQNAWGFSGAVFDGRYVYFVPHASNRSEIARYDTLGEFEARSSWIVYNPQQAGIVSVPTGYFRAVFDGRYVYFVPHLRQDGSQITRGEILRFDTTGQFALPQSWAVFDPGDHGVGKDPDGFAGAVFDGRYIYFVPMDAEGSGAGYNGEVIRYDTRSDFQQASSWIAYDSSVHGSVTQPHGYIEAAYDGRYVYFGPYMRAGVQAYSQVLRYDTQFGFQDPAGWSTFDPGAHGMGQTPGGYRGVVYDCRNVYFVPFAKSPPAKLFHSETLRYDTTKVFLSVDAWSAYNPVTAGNWDIPQGYDGAVFDGRYLYYAPTHDNRNHGTVLRYDTWIGTPDVQGNGVPDSCEGHPPITVSSPITEAAVGSAYTYDVDATDPDAGDMFTFSLTIAPAGMTIDPSTGLIVWTPTFDQVGNQTVTVRVIDAVGLFAEQSFTITVASPTTLITVPSVLGLTQAEAEAALAAAGLTVGTKTPKASTTVPAGTVISQNPLAGSVVPKGTAVALEISSGLPQPVITSIRVTPLTPTITTSTSQQFAATAIFDNGTSQPLSTGITWQSSNPSVAFVTTTPGRIGAAAAGTATISASYGGATGSTMITVVQRQPNSTDPIAEITSPDNQATVTGPVPVIGTASDPEFLKYVLEIAPVGETTYTTIFESTTPVVNGTLGTLDPTLLVNDLYNLQLRVFDRGGIMVTSVPVQVQIKRDQKVGNFTLAFQDVNVPVACLPLTVTRVYDSRDKRSGDFGVGWRLDLQTMRLRETGTMGDGWAIDLVNKPGPFGIPIPTYVLYDTAPHKVALTLPDGQVEEFDLTPSPSSNPVNPIGPVNLVYTPRPGTLGSLAPVVSTQFAPDVDTGNVQLIDSDVTLLDPRVYRYTSKEGTVFLIDKFDGVKSVQCTNGVALTVTPGGITHDSGTAVLFSRDSQGRITSIADPNGNSQSYGYDANGDLVSHTDAEGNTTRFLYNYNHGMIEIQDPRGVQPIRNEYDDAGRLISTTDAFSKKVTYTHDLAARRETVTDRLGNVTVHAYDVMGNVISTTDPLGGVTSRSYDAFGNELTRTDPLGRTTTMTYDSRRNMLSETDPLGKTTSYEYNALGQVKKIKDPLGRETSNTYDAYGNLTQTQDPLGNITTYTYDNRGLQTSRKDPLGNTTSYQYDGDGRLIRETDAAGRSTDYAYDANGNRTSETRTRTAGSGTETLTTTFEYDRNNRLVKTSHPDGSVTRTQYNAIGKQEVTTDQLGRKTSYEYDEMGRLAKTTYPDGAGEASEYDAEGRRTAGIDRAGRTTTYAYDTLGRLTQTTFPDNTATATTYDAAGQVVGTTDARGNTTTFEYDAAGRRTKVTDPLGKATTFSYDDAGNQTSVTDANGNSVQFTYDLANRRTRTTYPDGTFDTVTYDKLGRQVAKTDQAGLTTQFGYDVQGRLTSVTDALGQVTSYSYDELGNQLTQTDAMGRTTSFAYDKLGRRAKRTLPLGMFETMGYDPAGNLTAKTDFTGKTTTYAYDTANRLVAKTPDLSLGQPGIGFSYTVTGQRAAMTDAGGTTTYTYDNRDRLKTKATPQGTLSYTYDAAGNLASIRSSNPGGAAADYAWDKRNRLASVTDSSGATTYSYDNTGNLAGFLYPNGVSHAYTYNTLNRLTNLTVARGGTLAGYTYTLGPAGNRTAVTEASGRKVSYIYDNLYRLTGETISVDPAGKNGVIGYTYDKVGNRLTRTSTLTEIPAQSFAYDANDRITTESYDSNGNTTVSGGRTFGYDFENRLTSADGGVSFVYDGEGNRVARTVWGVTTWFLVDTLNPTGYAQVLEEISGGTVQKAYTYGLKLISQRQASGVSFYGYDGHGSVRLLTDASGAVTDTYDYDAFGNLIRKTGTTGNGQLYAGEEFVASEGLYYLRARYMNVQSGRFLTRDTFNGVNRKPSTLHKYIYAEADPIDKRDPSGKTSLVEISISIGINEFTTKSLLTSYYNRHFKFLREATEIVNCQLQPQYHRRNFALSAIANGICDKPVLDTYDDASAKILGGLNNLAKSAKDVYKPDLVGIFTDQLELKKLESNITRYDEITDFSITGTGNTEWHKRYGYLKLLITLEKATYNMYKDMQGPDSNRFEGCKRIRFTNYLYEVWDGLHGFIKDNGESNADPDWLAEYTWFHFNK